MVVSAQAHGRAEPRLDPRLALLEAIYRAEVGRVTGFFARRSRDPQNVADLTAETFAQAISSFASSPPRPGSERAWLFAIARRVYAKDCERHARGRDAADRLSATRLLHPDEVEELEDRIDAEHHGRGLLARLDTLPAGEREAVELVDLAELTPKQASATLGVSPGALRVRLFRARARLRKERSSS